MGGPGGHILIVDDDREICRMLEVLLGREGLKTTTACDGDAALAHLAAAEPDVMLLDVNIPGPDGMEVLHHARCRFPDLPVVIITAYGGITGAVDAIKGGACDYLPKPFDNHKVVYLVNRAVLARKPRDRDDIWPESPDTGTRLRRLMGPSPLVARLAADVQRIAGTDFSVIIQGETGTGKELVAREIHQASCRATGPFVAVDCGAISESLMENELFGHEQGAFTGAHDRQKGKFEAAQGGTLFLDEIANMPMSSQAKLLRALQERVVVRVGGTKEVRTDARVLVASNEDLHEAVASGRFRKDILYRLNEFFIRTPPLRERPEDIPHLAEQFLAEAACELRKRPGGFSASAMEKLQGFHWPGNVRELRSVVRRAALLADGRIEDAHLRLSAEVKGAPPPHPWGDIASLDGLPLREIVRRSTLEVERMALRHAMTRSGGNKAEVARLLQVDYKTIHTKLKKYGITMEEP